MQTRMTIDDLMSMSWDRTTAARVAQFLNEIGGVMLNSVGSERVKRFRFVNTALADGLLETAPSTGKVAGVTDDGGNPGDALRVRLSGRGVVYPSTTIALNDQLVAAAGGYAVPYQDTVTSMGAAVAGADARDDITQTNLPARISVICAGDETGGTVVVWGLVGGVLTKEIITLGAAATYTSVATFSVVYALQVTLLSTGTIDIKDAGLVGLLIPQIAGSTAARFYGAIVPNVTTVAKGLEMQIKAGGANTADVMVLGTDFAGVEQFEVVSMNGTAFVDCLKAYRTVTYIGIGADALAWNVGVTSQYTMQVPHTRDRTIRATALADQATVGGTVEINLSTQNSGQDDGYTGVHGDLEVWTAAATAIALHRFVDINGSALLEVAPVSGGQIFGVSDEAIGANEFGRVRMGGKSFVYPTSDVAALDQLVAVAGGLAAPALAVTQGLQSAQTGTDAEDDLVQTNLPDTVHAITGGIETAATMIIYGDVAGTLTKETVSLVGPAGTYTSTNTFTAVYGIHITAISVGTIDVEDGTGTGAIIPSQIAPGTAARFYGAVVPDDSTDSKGLEPQFKAGGANTADVMILGTDYAGAAQMEVITMNGTTYVDCTKAYRSVDYVLIGADKIVWNLGATSQYTAQCVNTNARSVRGTAETAQTVAGQPVGILLHPQRTALTDGAQALVFVGRFTTGGGAAFEDFTCTGVAATDSIVACLNVEGAATRVIVTAEYQAANTVRVTFDGDPQADHEISIQVFRP